MVLPGCTSYRPPRIRLVSVELSERTDEATAFRFQLEVTNDNTEPIELREVRYILMVEGEQVYEGRRAAGTVLHGGATATLSLPAVVPHSLIDIAGETPPSVSYRLSGGLLYVTPGELTEILLDTGVRRPTVQFRQSGRLEFDR